MSFFALSNPKQIFFLTLSSAVFFSLLIAHGLFIYTFSVDIPFWDDWEALGGIEKIPEILNLHWLLLQHNEHRIVFTKLQAWILYKLTNWNTKIQIVSNFFIFSSILLSIFYLIQKSAKDWASNIAVLILCFALSTASYENHVWAYQSQFHFVVLFTILSNIFLFGSSTRICDLLMGSLFLICAAASFSTGIVSSSFIGAAFVLNQIFAFRKGEISKKLCAVHCLAIVGTIVVILSYHVLTFVPVGHFKPAPLESFRFWNTFLNVVSFGFGYKSDSFLLGLSCFVLTLIPVFTALKTDLFVEKKIRMQVMLYSSALVAVACIAYGRSGFPGMMAKSSRYNEISVMLPIFSGLCWLSLEAKSKKFGLAALFILCFYGNHKNWRFRRTYSQEFDNRIAGVQCVHSYYMDPAKGANCATLYPAPLDEKLNDAKSRKISFYNKLSQPNGLNFYLPESSVHD